MSSANAAALAALSGGNTVEVEEDGAVDMDALLNQSLDDIPDLPDFVTPKEGAYALHVDEVNLNAEIGTDKKRAIQVTYTVTEVLELKGSAAGEDAKPGDKFSELFFMTTAKGADYTAKHLKKLLSPVAERMQSSNIAATLNAFAGCDIVALIVHQKDRDDKSKVYAKVKKIIFPN